MVEKPPEQVTVFQSQMRQVCRLQEVNAEKESWTFATRAEIFAAAEDVSGGLDFLVSGDNDGAQRESQVRLAGLSLSLLCEVAAKAKTIGHELPQPLRRAVELKRYDLGREFEENVVRKLLDCE